MSVVAITGAAGFIGSNLAHRMARELPDATLLLIDHPLDNRKIDHWQGLPGRYAYISRDVLRDALIHDRDFWPQPLDVVFHLGACSSTTERNWSYLADNNLGDTQRLWTYCARRGIPFYYASSAATYGDGSQGFSDRTHPRDLKPLNLYGKSKNDFDLWALDQIDRGAAHPPAWAGLKFFNVFGPREGHKGPMMSMVWKARRQIEETGIVRLFRSNTPSQPDGGQTRDFVYVEDCLDHLLWLWRHPEVHGLFNSGTGQPRTFLDLVHGVFSALERPPRIEFIPMPSELVGQYQNFTQADMSKLIAAGYPFNPTPLEVGIQRAFETETAGVSSDPAMPSTLVVTPQPVHGQPTLSQ